MSLEAFTQKWVVKPHSLDDIGDYIFGGMEVVALSAGLLIAKEDGIKDALPLFIVTGIAYALNVIND